MDTRVPWISANALQQKYSGKITNIFHGQNSVVYSPPLFLSVDASWKYHLSHMSTSVEK